MYHVINKVRIYNKEEAISGNWVQFILIKLLSKPVSCHFTKFSKFEGV